MKHAMKHARLLLSVLLGLFLVVSCNGDDVEDGVLKDFGAGAAPESKIHCQDVSECEDGDPCTIDRCHEGFCDPQSNPIDDDLDGYVSHICGGPDCDDENDSPNRSGRVLRDEFINWSRLLLKFQVLVEGNDRLGFKPEVFGIGAHETEQIRIPGENGEIFIFERF